MSDLRAAGKSNILIDMSESEVISFLEKENAKLKAQVELYSEAIEKIGHNGIDFGYGVFKCEPEKVAQDVSQKIKELG